MANAKQELYDRAAFGKQVEAFWTSDIGDYIMKRIASEVDDGFEKFKHADPRNGKELELIQNQINRAESIKAWLSDAVVDGLTAIEVLQEDE